MANQPNLHYATLAYLVEKKYLNKKGQEYVISFMLKSKQKGGIFETVTDLLNKK